MSNYRETDKTRRALPRESATALYELTLHMLKKQRREADFILRVEERPDGLFDLIVLERVN